MSKRFIPTCVGYIQCLMSCLLSTYGSSPRAWGICPNLQPEGRQHRFIPTCVGYMRRSSANSLVLPVHPHVRGVYF